MATPQQTYKTHVRFFPPFHFFVAPVLLINVLVASWLAFRTPSPLAIWNVIVALALVMLALVARVMALAVQDRVIRLEMRLRLREMLPTDLQPRIGELSHRTLVALRFASDAELPPLVRRVLDGELKSPPEIKQAIRDWQGDYLRA